jgi:hypothetical protein
MRFALVVVLALGAVARVGAEAPKPGQMIDNPPYTHWAQFKVGSSVTVKEVVTLTDGGVEEVVATSKLLSKDKDHLMVETVVAGADGDKGVGAAEETRTVTDFPAKVKFERTHTPPSAGYSVTEGKEVVDVNGKQAEAEWVEASSTHGDETVVEKVWTVQNVPGGIVKQTVVKKKAGKIVSQSSQSLVKVAATAASAKQ